MRFSLGVFLLLLAFTSQAQLAPQSLDSLVQAEVERNQFSGIILLADNGTPFTSVPWENPHPMSR